MAKTNTVRAISKPKPKHGRVPNKETKRALKEARARKNVETFDSVATWAKKLRSF